MKLLSLLFTVLVLAAPCLAKPIDYRLNADKSSVSFSYQFNGQTINGSMPVSDARLSLDFNSLDNSTVTIVLNADKARAGFLFATQAMRGKTILDTAQHPTIQFVSKRVLRTDTGAKITGKVTVRGVTKPLVLTARFYRQKGVMPKDLSLLTILLTGAIPRASFGANGYPKLVGDQINLRIIAHIKQVK